MSDTLRQAVKRGFKKLYAGSPAPMQQGLLAATSYMRSFGKSGREFRSSWELIERSQWFSESELRDLQAERLRALIAHAYATVPYYRSVFEQRRLRPDDIRTPADLEKLPVLTKDDVRNHFDELISKRYSRLRGHLVGTSGTTGTPLRILLDRRREAMEVALVRRHRSWAGFQPGELKAVLRGLEIRSTGTERPIYWRFNRVDNELGFSSSYLGDATLPAYLDRLREARPSIIWGYPSTVAVVADYLMRRGEPSGWPLKGVFLSSEPVYDWQRRVIEDAFACRVFDWYGLSEGVVSAGECDRHEGYHVSVESCVVETVPSTAVPGATELIATGLDNVLMPLIRYQTGDVSEWTGRPCSCGRGLPLLGPIQTKVEDVLVTPDGRWISPSVLTFPFKTLHGIAKSQIIQRSPEEVVIKVVPEAGYSPVEERRLIDAMTTRLGQGMRVTVEPVADIPRTAAGKYRWVISETGARQSSPRASGAAAS
jgi:phenylacetate-CoA ligase